MCWHFLAVILLFMRLKLEFVLNVLYNTTLHFYPVSPEKKSFCEDTKLCIRVLHHYGCFHKGGFLPALILFYSHSLLLSSSHIYSVWIGFHGHNHPIVFPLSEIHLSDCVSRQKCFYPFSVLEKVRITMATAVSVNLEYEASAISTSICSFRSVCLKGVLKSILSNIF